MTQIHPQEIPPDYFFWENENLTSIFGRMNGTGIRTFLAGCFLCLIQTTHPCLSQPRGSESIARQNLDVEAVFYDAAKAEMLENLEEATRLYEKVLRIDAGNAAAYYKLASIQIRQNKITEALKNAKEAAPDATIAKEEYRIVNGKKVLMLTITGNIQGINFIYFGYYYSNKSGTVQFLTYTAQNMYDGYLSECETLLNGLVDITENNR